MELKVIALVLLGPLAALYDFVTNPTAPPQIFVAQYTDAFGHPPNLPSPTPHKHKHVYLTQ
jgi:hypothetical protein